MGLGGDAVDDVTRDPQDDPMPYGVDTIRLRISFPAAPEPQDYDDRVWWMRPLRGWTGGARWDAQRAEGEAAPPPTSQTGGSDVMDIQRGQASGEGLVQNIQFAPGRVLPVPLPPIAIPGTIENENFVKSVEDLGRSAAQRLEDALKAIDKALHAQKTDEPPKPNPKISPSGEATTPTGPEDPDGDPTQPSQQDLARQESPQLTNNRVRVQGYRTEAKNGGILTVEEGSYTESELRAAQYRADQGNDVLLRQPKGTRATGGTSDLLVNGRRGDVYTPKTSSVDRIVSAIASKNSQAQSIVLDLSQTSVTADQLIDILVRVRGAGATNIQEIIILPK